MNSLILLFFNIVVSYTHHTKLLSKVRDTYKSQYLNEFYIKLSKLKNKKIFVRVAVTKINKLLV